MKDNQFEALLNGILNAWLGVSLESIIYSNNEIGSLSVAALGKLLEPGVRPAAKGLRELSLNNVSVKQIKDLRVLFKLLAQQGSDIRKLRCQQMNLNDSEVVNSLCQVILSNRNLQELQLSACHLSAKHLQQIALALMQSRATSEIQVLDLSGNSLSELVDAN